MSNLDKLLSCNHDLYSGFNHRSSWVENLCQTLSAHKSENIWGRGLFCIRTLTFAVFQTSIFVTKMCKNENRDNNNKDLAEKKLFWVVKAETAP